MDKTVLVIGATGTLGEPVARHLKEDGFRVRVMTRDSNKAQGMFDETFDIVVGDVMDAGSLEELLDGCFGVHISTAYIIFQKIGHLFRKSRYFLDTLPLA